MAEQPTYKFLPEDKCLTESQLFDYIDGKLKTPDMHFIEKHILSCGFCSDALDGLAKVRSRDKVAAFIPAAALLNKEEKEEPKVIPLNPNRKYYALAAGIVLILGITLFLKLSTSADLSQEKMADVSDAVKKDSAVLVPTGETEKSTERNESIALNENDSRSATGEESRKEPVGSSGPEFFKVEPGADANHAAPPPPKVAEEVPADQLGEADGDLADDFANVVDAKITDEEQKYREDNSKKEKRAKPAQKQATAQDKSGAQEKEQLNKNDNAQVETVKENNTKDVPVTLSTTAPTSQGTTATVPASTNSTGYVFTTPTGGAVTMTDSVTMYTRSESDRALDLSYENANKMLASGQAAASLALYDEVLKNPLHSHYQDAQWKKAEALIQLKRIEEAKKLLNEIAGKSGKYKQQAKDKLKTL